MRQTRVWWAGSVSVPGTSNSRAVWSLKLDGTFLVEGALVTRF